MIGLMLPARDPDGTLNVVVETPRGSTAKFKYDERDGVIRLSRPLPVGICYPYDWGYVPSTRAADGDALDAMVVWDGVSYPGVVISARCLECCASNRMILTAVGVSVMTGC